MRYPFNVVVALLAVLAMIAAACGSEDDTVATAADADEASGASQDADEAPADGEDSADPPTVVVTTTILGDVVAELVGEQFDVVTIMPVGADPHDFQASAQQVATIGEADALIVNGGSFEEGLLDVIEAAEDDGVPVFEALSAVETIEFGEGDHDHGHDDEHDDEDHDDEHEHEDEEHKDDEEHDDEHSDEDHDDEHEDEEHDDDHEDEDHDDDHEDEDHDDDHEDDEHKDEEHDEHGHDDHAHDGADPHFWTDPARMAVAADAIVDFLVDTVDGVDAGALTASADAYVDDLESLDAEVAETLSSIDESQRVLITNHDSFGYFADRFDFEVAGTVIPSGSTTDGTSARQLAELAELIEDEGVLAIFAETTVSTNLAETLAAEVGGDITVVELYTGSLGEPGSDGGTYIDMVRTNAERIADALG